MKKIEEIDKNFSAAAPEFAGMKTYDIHSAPFALYGLKYGENGFYRMDTEVADTVSDGVKALNFNTAGGCLRFKSDTERIILTATLPDLCLMNHMPLTGSSSFSIYCDGEFCGVFRAPSVEEYKGTWSSELHLSKGEKDIMILFPLYNNVKELYTSLEETAAVSEGNKFESRLPVVFYGSSITQGGCASHPGNAYTNIIMRELNRETINLGFSGSCKAEKPMADYIGRLPMSLFVYDYDHNAPDSAYLRDTHERFFKEFRSLQPDTPVLMLSVADGCFGKEEIEKRRAVIKKTCENARAAGDKNVYFLDGGHFYDEIGLRNATVDTCHPNDLGFYAFYKNISEFMKENNL